MNKAINKQPRDIDERDERKAAYRRALDSLESAGCDRGELLFLLSARVPPRKAWNHIQKLVAPSQREIRRLADRLDRLAQDVNIQCKSLFLSLFLTDAILSCVNEMERTANALRVFADGPLGKLRKGFSHRAYGKPLKLALIGCYVGATTGRLHPKEIAELLEAVYGKSINDVQLLEKNTRNALRLLTRNGRYSNQFRNLLQVLLSARLMRDKGKSKFRALARKILWDLPAN